MPNNIQYSNKFGDAILVVGGDDYETFAQNVADTFGPEHLDAFEASLLHFMPAVPSTAQAVATVQEAMPGSHVIHQLPRLPLPNNMTARDQELSSKGFLPDKYGNWWHPRQFEQAPACQCSADKNRGKLALKVGKGKSGGEYTGWYCPNTFGTRASNGCQAQLDNNYPEL